MASSRRPTRRQFLKRSAGLGAALTLPLAAPALSQSKPFQGQTLNVSCWNAPYPKLLQEYLPEFEALTGMKVNYDTPGFLIYNQRIDLELSTRGSAYDVLNVTFIYVDRWIRSGWFHPLDEFVKNENSTPKDWDVDDFLPAARKIMSDKSGNLMGIPWTCDCYMAVAGRYDLMEKAGLKMPETFDDIETVAKAMHKDGMAGFVGDNRHGWNFPPYLQGFGGNVFRKAPDDLMPALDTPEAIAAADFFSHLLRDYGPDGVLSYTLRSSHRDAQAGTRQLFHRRTHLPDAGGRCRQQGGEDGPLLGVSQRAGGTFSRLRDPCLGHSGRRQEQAGELGIHQVGDVEADDAARREGEGLFVAEPPLDHRRPGVQAPPDAERKRRRGHLSEGDRNRRRQRLHGLPHRATCSRRSIR